MLATTLARFSTLIPVALLLLQNRPDMIQLIPLAYFGIVCTSSTETAKIANFVFFLFLLIVSQPRALTIVAYMHKNCTILEHSLVCFILVNGNGFLRPSWSRSEE